jgi:hypothetical protein
MNKERLDKILKILGNNSNQLFRESYFRNNFTSLTNDILEYTKELDLEKFPQKVWHWVNEKNDYFICKTCNINRTNFNKNWLNGYRDFCSPKCAAVSETTKDKRVKTCLEVYGFDNAAKNSNIKQKISTDRLLSVKKSIKKEKIVKPKIVKPKKIINTNINVNINYDTESLIKELEPDFEVLDYNIAMIYLKHKKCNTNYSISTQFLRDSMSFGLPICTKCVERVKNTKKDYLVEWLKTLKIDYVIDSVDIIENDIIDIYLPEKKIAISFNDLYHNSEFFKSKSYHLDKSNKCLEKDIQLIHIWEDEWVFKQDIVKSIISNRLGLISNKIYARQCEIKVIDDSRLVREFLDLNHIQGYSQSSLKLGLYYNSELISLMTFGYRHTNAKKEFELIRFCNKKNLNVIGAASKLFNYFISNNNFDTLISYSDYRLFDGQMYNTLGFTKEYLSKPDYFWCIELERKHRFNFNKRLLIKAGFDGNLTENQIMWGRGYYKVFGCGQYRWEYIKK